MTSQPRQVLLAATRHATRSRSPSAGLSTPAVVGATIFALAISAFVNHRLARKAERDNPPAGKVVGLARIAPDVSADLARATIGSIKVLGALQAPAEIRAALKNRIS